MGRPIGSITRSRGHVRGGRAVSSLLLVLALAVAGMAGTAAAAPGTGPEGLSVLSADVTGIRLSAGPLEAIWRPREVPGADAPYQDLEIPGFSTLGEPGAPRTPRQGAWILVPPGTRPMVEVVKEQWEDAGGRMLMPEAVPVILPGPDDDARFVSEILVPYGQDLPEGVDIPPAAREAFAKRTTAVRGQALTVSEVSWWRGRRVARVQLVPVQHDGGRARRVLKQGEWTIRFVADAKATAATPPGPARRDGRGDERFATGFLNAGLLATLQPEALDKSGGAETAIPGLVQRRAELLAPEVRLAVKDTRLQRVTAARLRERGLLPDIPIPESAIRLYQRRYIGPTGAGEQTEIEVPILMVGDGDDFDGDDFFLFYGLRLRDDTDFTLQTDQGPVNIPGCGDNYEMNNEANIYWLAAALPDQGETWSRMEEITVPAVTGTPLASYRRVEHFEEQVAFREHNPDPAADRLFQNDFNDSEAVVSINRLWSPVVDGQDAVIEVGYAGFSNTPARLLRFDLQVDDVPVMNLARLVYLSTMDERTSTFSVPAGMLSGQRAEVVMTRDEDNATGLFSYLNWARIEYDAAYRALDNQLLFNTGPGVGTRPVEVTGFADGDLVVVDVTDPRAPKVVALQPENVRDEGGSWTLSLASNQISAAREFAARGSLHSGGVPEFSYISSSLADEPEDPRVLTGPEPDLLVITHADFRDAVDRWVQHRRARAGGDLAVKVVDVQDLYDFYSGGLHDAWAIKRFCAEAIARWGTWSLVLVGDANENVRELKVSSSARDWSTDFVPAHYHVQHALSYNPELLATDKWYATSEAGMTYPQDDYPAGITSPWEMYVGRFPCNSIDELNTMIDKVILVESPQAGQQWRRRGIFFADDAWSNGYGLDALSKLTYRPGEEVFASSTRDSLAAFWRGGSPVTLEADTLFLANWLEPLWPQGPSEDRTISALSGYAEQYALQPLLQALTRGGLVCFYQGHANQYVLCSEYWIQDELGGTFRQDVASMNNADAPWFFFGMGCHISDWAQNTASIGSVPKERSLSEKMMVRNGGGASGTYGSSGYEYITANRVFSEKIFRRWMFRPPVYDGLGGNTPALPGRAVAARSRWMVGELMWASEADLQAILGGDSTYRQMISQYTILGDPLMVLDAGEPVVTAAFADDPATPLSGEVTLEDVDGTNLRRLDITALDEAGIDRLEVLDADGMTDLAPQLAQATLPDGQFDQQEVHYTVDVPVRPFAHVLSLRVYDTGAPLPQDRHWQLDLEVPMTADILAQGQPVDPASFAFTPGVPVDFSIQVTSGASLDGSESIALQSGNLDLANVTVTTTGPHGLDIAFTASTATGGDVERSVDLVITDQSGSWKTTYVLQEGTGEAGPVAIGRVLNFPNPMADETRFVIETSTGGQGRIRVFATSGREVASIPFSLSGGEGSGVVTWNGRDGRGDELANGTYLYRVEMDSPQGRVTSDMQRLVVMR